jgi:hypothetical protein
MDKKKFSRYAFEKKTSSTRKKDYFNLSQISLSVTIELGDNSTV